tara:strand:- start:43552 stop:45195 length:1644 start_codon:yes stop_codon:yes gene_type:complete
MNIRVLLQSRLASKRLPAKALLPLAGLPLIVLAAKRAGNQGADILVNTSTSQSDDVLVEALKKYNIQYYRGPEQDVLTRFQLATEDLNSEDCVVRLTGDNPIPDGFLINEAIQAFEGSKVDFLTTTFPSSVSPYGLSLEIFKVKLLHAFEADMLDDSDREHVTPKLYSLVENKLFYTPKCMNNRDLKHIRCTIDTFADYLRVCKIFQEREDSIAQSWTSYVDRLIKQYQDITPCPVVQHNNVNHSQLILGTAQFGMDYGIANKVGMPGQIEINSIIQHAIDAGVTHFDSARAYGSAEKNIAVGLEGGLDSQVKVITKLSPLEYLSSQKLSKSFVEDAVTSSVYRSMANLKTNKLDIFLLHRWAHRHEFDEHIWACLKKLQSEGAIGEIGASLSTVEEAYQAICDPEIKHIQIPFNILDGRWLETDFQNQLKNRPDVRVHVRSVLLQGLLVDNKLIWPNINFELSQEYNQILDQFVVDFKRKNRMDLCFAYARSFDWITGIVVGVETIEQLKLNLKLFNEPKLAPKQLEIISNVFQKVSTEVLDPARW